MEEFLSKEEQEAMEEEKRERERQLEFERNLQLKKLKNSDKVINYKDFIFKLKQDDTYEVCYCSNLSIKDAEIPKVCNGKPVTSISSRAFEYCDYDSLGLAALDSNTIYSIKGTKKCESLETIEIPDSITNIYDRSPAWFDGTYCIRNTWSTLLEKVRITIDSNNPSYMINNGGIYAKDKKTLLCCNGKDKFFAIIDGTTNIAKHAIADHRNLESLVIPTSVKSFGVHAFPSYNLKAIFYKGTKADWENISIAEGNDNELKKKATVYFYSEKKKLFGKCWHYDVDGVTPTTVY